MSSRLVVLAVAWGCSCATVSSWDELTTLPGDRLLAHSSAISEVCESANRGEYAKALQLIQQEIDRGMSEVRLAEPYVRSLNGLLEQAEEKHLNDDPRAAGVLFRRTLDHYPRSRTVRREVAMRAEEVQAAVDVCADDLLAQGLSAYRAGQLEEAIELWTEIEEFHPNHEQSQQAIETTRVQLRNLNELSKREHSMSGSRAARE